ncbi:MAG: DUF1232 domain-containing protein [Chloroflexi bacterium]|nr:DUF1232 domain-containing protein [Chloroflexota bacterium]
MSTPNQVLLTIRLIWRLFRDRRVPWTVKLLPLFAIVYILLLPDFIPDLLLGFGQIDDLTFLLLGMKFFVDLAPQEVVEEHRRALLAKPSGIKGG